MNPLCICHSSEALKKVIASGKYDATSALKEITANCEEYYEPGEMINILLDNGADIYALNETWIDEYPSHIGKLLMLENFQRVKFISSIVPHNNHHQKHAAL